MSYKEKRDYRQTRPKGDKNASSFSTASTALAAVALQDHMSRSLLLQDPLKKKKINHSLPVVSRQRNKSSSSSSPQDGKKKIPRGEKEKEYVLDPKPPPLTLAQKLGLVDSPDQLLTDKDWQEVKKQSNARLDSLQPCVICKEDFGTHQQVLLSCSHVFHRACLEAFEKFSGHKTCPMCRKEQYQKRVIHEGAKHHRIKCAIKIQSAWRGYVVYCWYRKLRETVPPNDPGLRKKYYEGKLQSITDRLVGSMEASNRTVDSLLSEIDQSIASSRNIMSQVEEDRFRYVTEQEWEHVTEQEWEHVQLKAVERCSTECPICIMPLCQQGMVCKNVIPGGSGSKSRPPARPTVLLSCSHVFHATCLAAFEEFTVNEKHTCPVCRSTYHKKVL